MMEAFAAYIKTITALTVFSALVSILLPEGKDRRYAELVLGVLVLTAVLSPLFRLFDTAEKLPEMKLEQEMKWEQEWLDTYIDSGYVNGYTKEG